jgi:hypothetical protein
MRLGIGAILSLIAIGCAGCAAQPAAPIVSVVAPGQAKITITRTDTLACIAPCPVQVDANGNHLTELALGQTYSGGVPAGSVTLVVWQSLDIGQYKLELKAVPGKTYAFEVSPRTEHKVAAFLFGMSGLFAETVASGEHSGGFQITPVQ